MSVQAIAWVLDHSHTRGTDRLVLFAIANHAGANPVNGAWESWPGIDRIAREAGLERTRTAQDALARLEATGRLERIINGAPDSRTPPGRRSNLYRILIDRPPERGDAKRHPRGDANRHPWGDASRQGGVTRNVTRGVTRNVTQTVSRTVIEPSVEPAAADVSRAEPPPPDATPAAAADRPDPRISDAARLLAERRAAHRPDVGAGWTHNAARGIEADHHATAARLLTDQPALTATELADRLEPPSAEKPAVDLDAQRTAARSAEHQTTERNRALRDEPTDPETLRAGTDAARAALRRPRTGEAR